MNLHKNARTCPHSREEMVLRVLEQARPVTAVAAEFGVSRTTVYKWLGRYLTGGKAGLEDDSSSAHELPHKLARDWVDLIVELRKDYRLTGSRIATQLKLARSTVAGVLRREGLSHPKALEPIEPVMRYEHAAPGEMIHIDIKKLAKFHHAGHRVTGKPRKDSKGVGWEFVHVCIDDYSRLAYAEILPDEGKDSAVSFVRRAVRWFARHGITVIRVLTDNGSCYRSKLWRNTCERLGMRVKTTRPYRPQTNGKAERLIQTLLREWAYARAYATSKERKAVLPIYLIHYNQHRAHTSLGFKPPITRIAGVHNAAGIHT